MEFFNNIDNNIFKFKINTEGIDLTGIETRLLFQTEKNNNIYLIGKIENESCVFNVPELRNYELGDEGIVKLEIIAEDLYFPVWKEKFEIKSKATIKVSDVVESKKEKPKITASNLVIEKKEDVKNIKKEESKEEIKTEKEEPKEKEEKEEKESKKDKKVEEKVKDFNTFFDKK